MSHSPKGGLYKPTGLYMVIDFFYSGDMSEPRNKEDRMLISP